MPARHGVAQHHQLLRKSTETSEVLRKPRKTPEPMHVDDKVFTARDVATHLKMHVNAGRRLIHQGWLRAFHVGGRRLRITEPYFQV